MSKDGTSPSHLAPLGRVVGVHGLKGVLRVGVLRGAESPSVETFTELGEILVGDLPFRVRKAGRGRGHVLLWLEGVDARAQAEALVGQEVHGEIQRFPPLPPGEYYWFQILGLPVVQAEDGTVLGVLAEIMPTGAHDVYVVRQGTREVLLPAVPEVIREIDLKAGCIKVSPPPGLLELYAD